MSDRGHGAIHDQALLDRLNALSTESFSGEEFRTTRVNADPIAPSTSGGRWAPDAMNGIEVPILYTNFERDGSFAEVISFLVGLTPVPGPRPLRVSRLSASTGKTLRLVRANLETLGVDMARFGERDYVRTQSIGAAIGFLELDGLIAPSARWPTDNLMIFTANHAPTERLEVIDSQDVEWRSWAKANGFVES